MMDYVVVLTEKYDLLHMQLLDARQLIDKNHIVIERDKVDKVRFHLFHHFATRPSVAVPPTKDESVDKREEETLQVSDETGKKEGNGCQ